MKNLWVGLLLVGMLVSAAPAGAQYGNSGFGGGMGGGSNDAPPPPPPPGSVGNPPPPSKPVKYFDGAVKDITGTVMTVEQPVFIPGQPTMFVDKKFEVQSTTAYEPAEWKAALKEKVRVIYEPRGDKLVVTRVIRETTPP